MRERGQSLKLKSPADQTLTVKGLQVRMHTASGLLSLALLPPLLPNMHLAAKPFTFFFFMTTWPTFLALPSIPPPPPKCLLIVVNQQSIQHDTGHTHCPSRSTSAARCTCNHVSLEQHRYTNG